MREPDTSDRETFRRTVSSLQHEAESALIQGDVGPRLRSWSHDDPVSLFAAVGPSKAGWLELEPTFRSVAARLSQGRDVRYQLIAYDVAGTMAWTAGFLHFSVSMDGGPVLPRVLRITHIYRREADEWKIVHEHSNWDQPPGNGR